MLKCKVATVSGAATDSKRSFEAKTHPKPSAIPEIIVAPMNMPVIKDLVVDMSSFWNHLRRLSPTLVLVRDKSQNESFANT